jgi:hypothetical protein
MKKETTTTTLPAKTAGKVSEIIDLMLSIETLQDAGDLCTRINSNPPLYNLVMGGVPPVAPPPTPTPLTPEQIEAELREKIKAEILAEIKAENEKLK